MKKPFLTLPTLLCTVLALSPLSALAETSVGSPAPAQIERVDESWNIDESEAEDLFSENDLADFEMFDRAMDDYLIQDRDFLLTPTGPTKLVVTIQKSTQTMSVSVNGVTKYSGWKVSTGKKGHETRSGKFTPFEMNKNYISKYFTKKYGRKIVLPYGIKFDGGNLIHAASKPGTAKLGNKASHGCVRLHPANAKILYEMAAKAGMKNTRVIVK
jgi:hypothetical protein